MADRDKHAARNDWLTSERASLEEERNGLQETVDRYGLWSPGHFYSPHPDLEAVEHDQDRLFATPDALSGIDLRHSQQLELLEKLAPISRDQPFSNERDGRHRYHFDNDMFSAGDGLVYHCLLRYLRPRRVVEVGIGYSSALLLDTVDEFLGGRCSATFIDPHPERMVDLLGAGEQTVDIIAERVQDISRDIFSSLEAGDVLFIDSTHVSKIGSDVNYLYFEVMPSLAPGVFVHIHDIFWPFEYPRSWVLEGRAWNEAYLLRGVLINNSRLEIVWFNDYLRCMEHDRVQGALPLWARNPGGSVWLQVR
ncbi:MAG: class I SAM-dependent methyltransferase [Actinomycetota bacterium]|nr:class I SAM-dependent methyltransferase [Actinomycetota bacterium]